ncbi:DUF535 family protein [Cupriavidus sp. USMAA2-4]|uniref:DUF535 family protein n=1 Tax=Cupriavidus sp. USMAA2-4 TaxID=876364 RepID=UPI000A5650D8|nr:DUF535 family protein [Cupriavidus sp. USMAA2-4]
MQEPLSSLSWLASGPHARGLASWAGPLLYCRYLGTVANVSAACHPVGVRRWWLKRLKLIGRAAFRAMAVLSWLRAAASCALLRRVASARPVLLERPFRPLARFGLGFDERARVLLEHYRLMHDKLPAAVSERIYLDGGLRWALPDVPYALRLADSGPNPKEGELAFYWMDLARGTCLAQLSFYLAQGQHGIELFVGGLQGPAGPDSRDAIREATRACDGLRPKDAVMEALLALGAALGAERVVAVSRRNHVGRQRRTPRAIQADYESFWTEAGGQGLPCGNVSVPVAQPRRDLATVPSKKRAAYRRKQARGEAIEAAVRAWLAVPAGVAADVPATGASTAPALAFA